MPYLGSCNIACGGHAGDTESMRKTVLLARDHGVKIGAHPSFLDRVNFGRKVMNIPSELLKNQLKNQIFDRNCLFDLRFPKVDCPLPLQ